MIYVVISDDQLGRTVRTFASLPEALKAVSRLIATAQLEDEEVGNATEWAEDALRESYVKIQGEDFITEVYACNLEGG